MSIDKFFSQIYEFIKEKFGEDDIFININNGKFQENFYDIYYHFKLLEQNNRIGYIRMGAFNYSNFFIIEMPGTNYQIKIMRKDNEIWSCVCFDNYVVEEYNELKHHCNYKSLENEIYKINIVARTID